MVGWRWERRRKGKVEIVRLGRLGGGLARGVDVFWGHREGQTGRDGVLCRGSGVDQEAEIAEECNGIIR